MNAILIERHGDVSHLKLIGVPEPSPKSGEVLVKIEASGINPSDVASVEGRFPESVLPRIVGRDFAGRVVKGPPELIGAEVWGSGGDLGISRDGTHAEFVAIPQRAVARRPGNITAEGAATVGVPFVTAFSALVRLGQLKENEWVIVSGAAGAVGQAAIQIAHALGARIVALVRNAHERWVSESEGVYAIAQIDQADLPTVVREATNGKGANLALNAVGGGIFESLQLSLKPGARHVVYSAVGGREINLDTLSFYRNQFALLGLNTQTLDATQCANVLNQIAPMFESGALKPLPIGERYHLPDAAEAYGRVASGGHGKIVFAIAADRDEGR